MESHETDKKLFSLRYTRPLLDSKMNIPPPLILQKPLYVPKKLLMGPGPSNCSQRVLNSMTLPQIAPMNEEVFQLMDEVKEGIRYVFQTRNNLTLAMSTSGHGGMEATLSNILEPGDTVLVAVNGIWGERACMMAARYGAKVCRVDAEPGNNFTYKQLEQAIVKYKPLLLFIVQGDSSTGVYQSLENLGAICHKYNCFLAVDTVASLGGVPFYADKWGVDVVYTGSQKALGAPPGFTPISFSKKAEKHILNRKTPVKVFFWDMTILGSYWNCFDGPRYPQHTICPTLLYALREALSETAEEGLNSIIRRHQKCANRLYQGLQKMGLELFVKDESKRLPTVTTIKVPSNVNWRDVTQYAMKNYLLEISGGLGPTFNQVFRVGIMGHNATLQNVEFVLKVLKEALDTVPKQSNL